MKIEEAGGKAYNLHYLASSGLNIPAFTVIPANVFLTFNEKIFALIPEHLDEQNYASFDQILEEHFNHLKEIEINFELPSGSSMYAVRSSGTEEDGSSSSFAGQFESFLFVKSEDIKSKIIDCWRSRFSFRALSYIRNKKVNERFPLAVLIQVMIPATKSGVMVTANVDRQEPFQTVISAALGCGEGLVSGHSEADTYILSQEGNRPIREDIVQKLNYMIQDLSAGGLIKAEVPAHLQGPSVLSQEELSQLGLKALEIEHLYNGIPQDIEWCFSEGRLYILQARPLTSWPLLNKSKTIELWDSSNIGESYHGSVSPLTFSFSRENYHNLFKALLIDLGCTDRTLMSSEVHLENLLGQYKGHLYYRLSHWKKLLVPLPGGPVFMKLLGSFIGSSGETGNIRGNGLDLINAFTVVLRILQRYTFREKYTRDFEVKYAGHIRSQWQNLDKQLDESELMISVRSFYDNLFSFWHMPTYNDFLSVVWVGIFEKLISLVFSRRSELERNEIKLNLIGASKGLGPVIELKSLIERCRTIPHLMVSLRQHSPETLTLMWEKQDIIFSEIRTHFQNFLNQWGFRCEDELMLEAVDLLEDPTKFFEQIQMHLNLAEATVVRSDEVLELKGLKERLLFPILKSVAARTKEHLDTRETMRIKRSELFALMRRYVKRLGNAWSPEYIDDPQDIFLLHLDEVRSGDKLSFRQIINSRRQHSCVEAPERFYSDSENIFIPVKELMLSSGISGTPCFGGIVRGEFVFYEKGMNVTQMKDKILVTERSGPGHVAYFPHIKAMIVEKGSTLSHAIIAAREFGLPTIVGVPQVMQKLSLAKEIEVNANSGEIIITSL